MNLCKCYIHWITFVNSSMLGNPAMLMIEAMSGFGSSESTSIIWLSIHWDLWPKLSIQYLLSSVIKHVITWKTKWHRGYVFAWFPLCSRFMSNMSNFTIPHKYLNLVLFGMKSLVLNSIQRIWGWPLGSNCYFSGTFFLVTSFQTTGTRTT